MDRYELLQMNSNGRIIRSLEGNGKGMLQLWALQNTNGKKKTVIRNMENKEIVMVVLGRGNDFPKVFKDKEEIDALGIKWKVVE